MCEDDEQRKRRRKKKNSHVLYLLVDDKSGIFILMKSLVWVILVKKILV